MSQLLAEFLKANPLFASGILMAVVGWIVVQARDLPLKFFTFIRSQFTTTLQVYSEDNLFRRFELWLSLHPDTKFSRRFAVTPFTPKDSEPSLTIGPPGSLDDGQDYKLTPGQGFHFLRHKGKFFFVNKSINENQTTALDSSEKRRKQTISITAIGRNQKPLYALLDEVKSIQEDQETIGLFTWDDWDYTRLDRRRKRPMDTIYLNESVKSDMIADLTKFYSRREWYATNAIPFRRGYFLSGPPGTGKSSFIFALASYFNKPVYIINLATIEDDNRLLKAINAAGPNFIVIEDIDSYKIVADREAADFKAIDKEPKSGVTLSGLLNALDGIGAREGRILFITSNTPEIIDKAILRPGRIDHVAVLDHAGPAEARAMFDHLNVGGDADAFLAEIGPELPLPAAELQNRLLAKLES